ncbi:hypothetical protein F511_30436 [Dorcoceras hygrometricum]|uniref:Patatin n=1 Tax=Dorcoceras hygrometricum TaxID=472368 RepID=A0A2Z7AGG2_9LAMI|nr:hypothetical protein F511_30436 [Dorcoceras hygrometricum]
MLTLRSPSSFPPSLHQNSLDFCTSQHQSTALVFSAKPFCFSPKKWSNEAQTHSHRLQLSRSWQWRARAFFKFSFLDKSREIESLKQDLLQAIAPLDRGAAATPEDQQSIELIVRKLESMNKVKEPLKSSLLNGKWELLYTTSKSILQNERPKFFRPNGKIYQAINVDTLRAQNMETWPFFNQATANLVPLNERRVAVKFDSFKIAALIPIKSRGSGRGQLEITYLDDELRMGTVTMFSKTRATHFAPSTIMASASAAFLQSTYIATATNTIVPLRTVNFSTKAVPPNHQSTPQSPPPQDKKSFAVATGELFLGVAARILSSTGGGVQKRDGQTPAVEMFVEAEPQDEGYWWWRKRRKEKIAAVIEDPVQPDVVWEQSVEDVEAERRRKAVTSPGFSFSAAGLLFPYHLGVAQFLIENGYIKETTPLAGASAGAIVCAVIASGSSMQEALKATKMLAEDCRLRGTAFRLGAVLRDILDKFLPDDTHIRSNGRVRVAVTQVFWRPRGLLVDQFDSKEDLINAVITSSFIPGYLAPRPATMFRNRLCIDGGLTLFMPPTSAVQTVRICAFPAGRLGIPGIGISPDCNPENRASPRQLFNWALEPAEDNVLDNLFELGYIDAATWAKENPLEKIVEENTAG